MTADITRLASRYGGYGYRRITAMLRSEVWAVNAKRVERILAAGGAEGSPQATEERSVAE